MEVFGIAVLCSVIVYCVTMIHKQKVNLDFHREEAERRRREQLADRGEMF